MFKFSDDGHKIYEEKKAVARARKTLPMPMVPKDKPPIRPVADMFGM